MSRRTLLWLGISWLALAIGFVIGRQDGKNDARQEVIDVLIRYSDNLYTTAVVLEMSDARQEKQLTFLQQQWIPHIQRRLQPYAEEDGVGYQIERNRKYLENAEAKLKRN